MQRILGVRTLTCSSHTSLGLDSAKVNWIGRTLSGGRDQQSNTQHRGISKNTQWLALHYCMCVDLVYLDAAGSGILGQGGTDIMHLLQAK